MQSIFFIPDIDYNPSSGIVELAVVSAGPLYEKSPWLPDGMPHMPQEFLVLLHLLDEASSQ